jgi:hypothetical protein
MGKSKTAPKTKHKSSEIDFDDQLNIWKLRPGVSENFAGKLSLCIGMPVMIRNNDATELCITNGPRRILWLDGSQYEDLMVKLVLDTSFVELYKPPQQIQIPGLPKNVVPIMKVTKTVDCVFPSD